MRLGSGTQTAHQNEAQQPSFRWSAPITVMGASRQTTFGSASDQPRTNPHRSIYQWRSRMHAEHSLCVNSMERRVPLAEQRLSSNANQKFKGEEREMTMKATTMNETTTDNMRELTADELADTGGGLFGPIINLWNSINPPEPDVKVNDPGLLWYLNPFNL